MAMAKPSTERPEAMATEDPRPESPLRDQGRRAWGEAHQGEEGMDTMDFGRAVLVIVCVAVPNAVLLVCLSGIGDGLKVFNGVAAYSLYGDYAFLAAAFSAAVLYICNWPNWSGCLQVMSLALPWCLGCVGTVFKGRKYPYGPALMCVFLEVLLLGLLRAGPCKHSRRVYFYRVTYLSTCLFGLILGAMWAGWVHGGRAWNAELREEWAGISGPIYENVYERALDYARDCGPGGPLHADVPSSEERAAVKKACGGASRVLFMVWACPVIGCLCNFIIGLFVFLNGIVTKMDGKVLERDLRRFVLFLVALMTGMYGSTYVAGTNMRLGSTLLAFFLAGVLGLIGWMILEVGVEVLTHTVVKSRFAIYVQKGLNLEIVQAGCIGVVSVLLPILYALEKTRQQWVRIRGMTSSRGSKYEPGSKGGKRDLVTEHAQQLESKLKALNWTGIFLKICLFGEAFFTMQVGVAKATYVFLSWLNATLATYAFGMVVGIIVAIGFAMFLLPPVPGVPVYVFCGVVIAAQGANLESLGFWGGTAVAIAVAWGLKLTASCGQYLIGFFLGKSVKVQQLIGVDKALVRAIQHILERPGLHIGKVAVLVGGPDWPVSVTCGILRLNVAQMLLGTAPVIFTLAPCTLAGAFLTRVTGNENSIWNVLSSLFMSSAVCMQMGSMFLAVYYIGDVMDKHMDELCQPREEHRAVEELTRKEMAYNRAYKKVTAWESLHWARKAMLLAAVGGMLLQGFVFAFADEMCFENFSVSSRINDPLDEGGLGGNVVKIIIIPAGPAALGLFAMACLLHIVITQDYACMAKREHARMLAGAQDEAAAAVPPQMLGASAD